MNDTTLSILNAVLEENARTCAQRGFTLNYKTQMFVLAKKWQLGVGGKPPYLINRDGAPTHVLLGGLGACGVGMMWSPFEEKHTLLPGYQDALVEP